LAMWHACGSAAGDVADVWHDIATSPVLREGLPGGTGRGRRVYCVAVKLYVPDLSV
jgi:hypothetical protein